MNELWWLAPAFVVVALLYSSVGHGGASGYLALLALLPGAIKPEQMASTALTLNVLVSLTALITYASHGHLSWRLALPFAATSVPAAFLGGLTSLPVEAYAFLLAACLVVAAIRLWIVTPPKSDSTSRPSLAIALPTGGAIGWLSGAVGVGGGIFLSPIMLIKHWATVKQTAACAAFFILVNSLAGLAGRFTVDAVEYGSFLPLLAAALIGGLIGSRLGARHLPSGVLNRLLSAVLVVAAVKLVTVAAG